MKFRWLFLALLLCPAFLQANEPKDTLKKGEAKFEGKPSPVPFRLTDTHHTLVRVKINGKGPFNFIVDTGCPYMLLSEPVGKKIGLKGKGWTVLDKLELEGGIELTKVNALVETPFQIDGMNSMGLAGAELHGLMGYTVLAKFKMEFDFTKKTMVWTPVKKEPIQPDMRGFFGFEMKEANSEVHIANVVPDSPAAKAGLKKGDRILSVDGNEVTMVAEVMDRAGKFKAGMTAKFSIERDKEKQELKITAGNPRGGGGGGLDTMVKMVSFLAALSGIGPAPAPQPRGYFGFEMEEKDKNVVVAAVLAKSPAADAGLKAGDRILSVEGAEVASISEVLQKAAKMTAGKTLTLSIERNNEKQELKITAGDGL